MAARAAVIRLRTLARPAFLTTLPVVQRVAAIALAQKYLHGSSRLQNVPLTSPKSPKSAIAASVEQSNAPAARESNAAPEEEAKNAAYLGEADSDDGFEAGVETHPEAHRHQFSDVAASGLHGQAGEGDEPIERDRKPQEALDAAHSAYLGEADSDDAHETDRDINPENYRHRIDDARHAAYLGEADSDDAHEADREANPERYRHKIEDAGSSGMHGESGEGDELLERNR